MILFCRVNHKNYIFTFLNSGAIFSAINFSNFSLLGLEFVKTISVNPKSAYFFNFFIPSSSLEITSNISFNVSTPITLPFSNILGSCISLLQRMLLS